MSSQPVKIELITCSNYKLKPGQSVKISATKENLPNSVLVTIYADNTKVCELNDTRPDRYVKRAGQTAGCGPEMAVDQIRIDNWPNGLDPGPYIFGVTSTA